MEMEHQRLRTKHLQGINEADAAFSCMLFSRSFGETGNKGLSLVNSKSIEGKAFNGESCAYLLNCFNSKGYYTAEIFEQKVNTRSEHRFQIPTAAFQFSKKKS